MIYERCCIKHWHLIIVVLRRVREPSRSFLSESKDLKILVNILIEFYTTEKSIQKEFSECRKICYVFILLVSLEERE